MKSTTTDRIVSTIRNEIVSDRHFLPDVKEKLCSTLNHYEIFQLAQLVAKSISDDDRLKVILLQEKK